MPDREQRVNIAALQDLILFRGVHEQFDIFKNTGDVTALDLAQTNCSLTERNFEKESQRYMGISQSEFYALGMKR